MNSTMPFAVLLAPLAVYGWFSGMKWLERNLRGKWRLLLWPRK